MTMKTVHFLLIALIALIVLVLVPAAVAVLGFGFSASSPAQDSRPLELTGVITDVKVLANEPEAVVHRVTASGDGTLGKYQEDSTVTFVRTGATWLFEARSTITVLDAKGERTGDVIEMQASGSSPPGSSLRGPFRVLGGAGRYDGVTGTGSFEREGRVATYKGLLR
jgi:hypothetical protein